MKDELNYQKTWELYRQIKIFENQNVKTQKYSDKEVVNKITAYLEDIVRKEAEKGEI